MTVTSGIAERRHGQAGQLPAVLQEVQARYSYLPEEALRAVAEETGRPLVEIYGVATFYRSFSLKPRGKHLVTCCLGTACHVRGAPKVAEELERQLRVKRGDTTADRQFTLETQHCLGGCALGPNVVVDGHYFRSVGTPAVAGILEKARQGLAKLDIRTDERIFPIEVACARCNHSLMNTHDLIDGLPSIWVTASFGDKHGWLRLSSSTAPSRSSPSGIPGDAETHPDRSLRQRLANEHPKRSCEQLSPPSEVNSVLSPEGIGFFV